jgi:hypothetical protein
MSHPAPQIQIISVNYDDRTIPMALPTDVIANWWGEFGATVLVLPIEIFVD